MSIHHRAEQLERQLKRHLKPQDISIEININPCYSCDGCEKCEPFHKEMSKPDAGRTLEVNGDEYDEEDC